MGEEEEAREAAARAAAEQARELQDAASALLSRTWAEEALRRRAAALREELAQLRKDAAVAAWPRSDSDKVEEDLDRATCLISDGDIASLLPSKAHGTFLKVLLGPVNLRARKEVQFKVKEEYNSYRDRTAVVFLGFPTILLFLRSWLWNGCFPALPVQLYQAWLLFLYTTLALRENILRVNGSDIRPWYGTIKMRYLLIFENYDCCGNLKMCIAEVTNTPWGERVMFTFQPGSDLAAKPLHVSPFMDMLGNWSIRADAPGDNLYVAISVQHPTLGNYFTAALHAKLVGQTSNSVKLATFFWLMPHKVAGWIYWELCRCLCRWRPETTRPLEPTGTEIDLEGGALVEGFGGGTARAGTGTGTGASPLRRGGAAAGGAGGDLGFLSSYSRITRRVVRFDELGLGPGPY